jgi:8-oxo-dGTP pyrophosphatase MutT (NUDIX family)
MKFYTSFKSLTLIFLLGTVTTQTFTQAAPAPQLSKFQFSAASVLPTYKRANGDVMVILGQEAFGRDKNTYDDFGGKRDSGEKHPEITAARECFEELILGKTARSNLRKIRKHINVDAGNTQYIIARTSKKSVVYITDFSKYWDTIRKKFYSARYAARSNKYKEKNHLVVTNWTTLETAVAQSQPDQPVTMQAYSVKKDGSYGKHPITIPLRPFFVAKLRPFFQNKPFTQGRTATIRFYH